jgi:iron complex outermembrane recepter protein
MKNWLLLCCFFVMLIPARSQETPVTDTPLYRPLEEVVVTGFEQNRRALLTAANAKPLRLNVADQNNKTSLVHTLNTVAGVRMEERSPGSYRINIRGSSLRSPFGVRNVKVYWNGIPVTDPGGNTYFNQFAFNNFSAAEVFKGPAGSMYGAGTGGLILLHTLDERNPGISVEYTGGSFGLHNIFAAVRTGGNDNRSLITYAHNQHDGYRVQSAMRRDNVSWSSLFRISGKQELRANILFTDMYYQTPGGLTKAEFEANPKAARPAAGGFPSAEQAKATIYQKNFLAGVQHRYQLDSHWTNATALYLAYAQIKNPAVRNYERRNEPHAGGRTIFTWQKKSGTTEIKLVGGGELQHGFFNTRVFGNKQGMSDTLQTDDEIDYNTYSVFLQADLVFNEKWFVTTGTSLNNTKVEFTRLNSFPVKEQERTYRQEWAPRIMILRKLGKMASVSFLVSKGFSPPSISELLPSTGNISTHLEAETGWNYEAGLRKHFNFGRHVLGFEVSGYYFKLNNTLVQRKDNSGADFFINAGDTRQKGLEVSSSHLWYDFSDQQFMQKVYAQAAYTYSNFRYGSFVKDTIDFSGKTLPSVPSHTITVSADIEVRGGVYLRPTYYYASQIFLNDANTAFAEPYHLLGLRLGWEKTIKKITLNFYAGADNLLDEVYSLGNDINDPRGRYYNTAARRNYYAGASFRLNTR